MSLIYSVEDDGNIAKIINKTLTKQGHEVLSFFNGKDFFTTFYQRTPDLILLDIMLPDMDGIDILKKIRENENYDAVEIIILSAKNLLIDKVEGLDLGADDYIEKPFDLLELMSRVNARLRKHKNIHQIMIKDIQINIASHEVKKNNVVIPLTKKEFEILLYLAKHFNEVVPREDLLNHVWGSHDAGLETRTIDMHIKSLRKKLNDDSIQTIYGIGYKIG
ncbi:MAG TPA: response regulator transcription factor [Candidatus Caccosoma faecigallinarum]|jgi:phosphate regulon response regulator phoB|uniref:Response regulator transcription factor n=1 Tax=Candidatus Caccosoma faecigallinarum TaxID=2840720 RepID=A0A9D1K9J1_9FIRM|nr:response regulator [Firmicutes bacterium CAG:631]HIT17262.1 response regulator transcription factor [Candidatus Caccosoma faecigallinarum]